MGTTKQTAIELVRERLARLKRLENDGKRIQRTTMLYAFSRAEIEYSS